MAKLPFELNHFGLFLGLLLVAQVASQTYSSSNPNHIEPESSTDKISEEEDAEILVDDEVNNSQDSNKFSWLHHQIDHSNYAQRSLMSTSQIVRPESEPEESGKNVTGEEELDPLKTIDFAEKEWQLMFRAFDLIHDSLTSSLLQQIGKHTNLFDDVLSRLKPACRRDIYHIRDSLKKHRLWALRMVDSNGKIPSGVTYGKFSSPGDYEECLAVNVDETVYRQTVRGARKSLDSEKHKFRGKYCLLDFRLPLPERPANKLLSIHDPVLNLSDTEIVKEFPELKNYSGYASVFYEVGYMHAVCIPSTCEVTDLTKSIGKSLENLYIIVNNTVDCQVNADDSTPLRTSQIISIILLCLLFANAAIASLMHYLLPRNMKSQKDRGDSNSKLDNFRRNEAYLDSIGTNFKRWATKVAMQSGFYAECFSVQTNFERLTKPDPRGLTFVHYTRIVAMALTVITHTGGLGTLQALTKPADASNSEQIFRDFIPQMLANAFTSIQIFFFMAGFMLVISSYPSIKRDKGHISFVEYAIKRAIRLMPGIAATICLNFLWPLVVDGPMLSYFDRVIVVPCESNWWRTMLFLSNFDHVEKMCLRHSYFSASDYQLHVMAFPLLILLYKSPGLSLFLAGIITVAGFAAQVIMILTKTVLPFMMVDYIDKEAFFNVVHYIHHPVWNHMSAFFYGFIIGYLVVKQIRINMSATTIKRIWMIIGPAGVLSIFAPYFWNHYKRPIFKWQMVLYVLIDRFTLLTTCAWLSYASMVLARKPQQPRNRKPVQQNLPDIVSLVEPSKPTSDNKDSAAESELKLPPSPGLTKQRSSPNILASVQEGSAVLRPVSSTLDISSSEKKVSPSSTGQKQQSGQSKPGSRPISNVNTLCLVLSRLTFQLYLFNMVVLWVDVNHSKYMWYFSYYFIITKALAVYIFSSIMAMIFFVTLESPCLTLYIIWVKSRAHFRAKRSAKKNDETVEKQDTQVIYSQESSSGKSTPQIVTSFDGLCMRTESPNPVTKPSFSFVDLSSPSVEQNAPKSSDSDQTKM